MSCLNLRIGKKLLPARKAWRDFTSKLQTKLLKLHSPKPTIITKPRHRLTRPTPPLWPSLSLLPPQHPSSLRLRKSHGSLTLRRHTHARLRRSRLFVLPKTKMGPVYVDELFREPDPKMAAVVEKHRLTPTEERKEAAEERASTRVAKMKGPAASTDDMWESVALGSPHTKGIDERAEEFIARFRAEMEMQEALAQGFK